MQKSVIVILGSFGSGKTTLARALRRGGAEERSTTINYLDGKTATYRSERVRYTIGQHGVAIAGTLRSGSDGIRSIGGLQFAVELLLRNSDVVIVDAFRTSCKFVEWLGQLPIPNLRVVFVVIDLAIEVNVARLMARRAASGKSEAQLPDRTYRHLLSMRRRSYSIWEYARRRFVREPRAFLRITEEFSPTEAAALVWQKLESLTGASRTVVSV
jgi:energy-coupling factor transporter ATP-binding protein EcfA2